ncbi:MAG TPA: sialidase family protein [Longimicrobium sp.]|nr:sialidase family protein [Longimicrobium sp.]
MSVLSFPRIYFAGYMEWNVDTANNNDYVPIYDGANAALDWDYLATLTPPITPANFKTAFQPWVITPTLDACPPSQAAPPLPPGTPQDACTTCGNANCHMGSRWNYYGNQGCSFVQYGAYTSVTTGGATAYGQPASSTDPILGQPISLTGRLVDINPASPFCSQIYFNSFSVGGTNANIGGPQYQRMYSRSFFVPRNIASDLIIAGAIGVIFQTAVPTELITSTNSANSALLQALIDATQAEGAQGLMLRFATYNTLYYQNGTYNDYPAVTTCDQLTQMLQAGKVFLNPAYSSVVGAVGVWYPGELATAPGGHMLIPNATVTPVTGSSGSAPGAGARAVADDAAGGGAHKVRLTGYNVALKKTAHAPADTGAAARTEAAVTVQPPVPLALGVIMAEVNGGAGIVSLDLMNAIAEWTSSGTKFDYGTFDLGVHMPDGTFNLIGSFGSSAYDQAAYQAGGGIVDVPFTNGVTADDISGWLGSGGGLALQAGSTLASLEAPLTVQSDDRGIYVDQCQSQRVTIQVLYQGAPAPAGTPVLLAEYYPWPLVLGTGLMVLSGTAPPSGGTGQFCNLQPQGPYLTFLDGNTVTVGSDGTATFSIASTGAGFPIIVYYPYPAGETAPTPQPTIGFSFVGYDTPAIGNAYYSTVRALPYDNALPQQFVDCWNAQGAYAGQPQYNSTQAWNFVYNNILYLYDMLYPAMSQIIDFGSQTAVEGAIGPILARTQADIDDTYPYMPVTRELSAGKRLVLEAWGGLVQAGYPQQPLQPIAVGCTHWSPQQELRDRSTATGPALATAGVLCMAWQGTGQNNIWVSVSSDGGATWSAQQELSDRATRNHPALCAMDGTFIMAWRGLEQDSIWVSTSTDGLTWTPQQELTDRSTASGPALSGLHGLAVMAWRDEQNNISVSTSSDGVTWGAPQALTDRSTSTGPGLTGTVQDPGGHKFLMAWQDDGQNISISTSTDGLTWSAPTELADRTTTAEPGVTHSDSLGQFYMAWRGPGAPNIWVSYSQDGLDWSPPVELTDRSTNAGPALTPTGNTLYMAWQGSGQQNIWVSTLLS